MGIDLDRAFCRATTRGNLAQVAGFLAMGVDPKYGDSWALQEAAMLGHTEIVKLLLPLSDPKANASWALRVAAEQGHLEIVRLLLPLSDIDQVMLDAAFIETNGCDFLLSCLPAPKARKLLAVNPEILFPRTRAMLDSASLQQRPATSHKVATQRQRT